MQTNIIDQRFFKDDENTVFCLDIMPMNQDSWQSEIQDGWQEISKKEADKIRNPPLTKEQLIERSEAEKQLLIAEAADKTELWRTQLVLGIITDEDKASLKEWMLYVQKVQTVDVSAAPDITWPVKP